jgi:hypothetical protein
MRLHHVDYRTVMIFRYAAWMVLLRYWSTLDKSSSPIDNDKIEFKTMYYVGYPR